MGDKEKPKEKEKDQKKEETDKETKKEKKKEEESRPKEGKEIDPPKESKQVDAKDGKNEKVPGGKEKKKEDEKGRRKKLQPGMVVKTVDHAFKIEKLLGSGGFGDVYKVSLMDKENELYALKTEYEDAQKRKVFNRLKIETAVLEDINKGRGAQAGCFTKLIDKGYSGEFRFVVMELVGFSLQYIYKELCKKQIPDHSAMYLMRETLIAIDNLHTLGYIHRDIKPHNFAVGLAPFERRVYILDFGIARKYIDDQNKFVVPRKKVPFLGTLKYCSRACHQEREQSVKDDLECWAYMCLEFYAELPWQKKKERDEILKMKNDLFTAAKENKGPWPATKGFFAEIFMEIDKLAITHDLKRTKILKIVDQAMEEVMKETKADEKTRLTWEGQVMPESKPRKKRGANRVEDDEESSERKKRDEKAKKRKENLARAKKIEEELLKVMKEIDEGDGPEDKKELARRMARGKRRSDQRRRRSDGRKRRETFDEEDDYDDDDDDDEEDSHEEERIPSPPRNRRHNRTKRSKYIRDEDSKMKRKTMRKRTSRLSSAEGTHDERKKSLKKRKKPSRIRRHSTRRHRPEEDRDYPPEAQPKDNGRESGKRASAEKIDEMDGEKKDSGKRNRSNGGLPMEGSKEKPGADKSPTVSANQIDGSPDKGKKK